MPYQGYCKMRAQVMMVGMVRTWVIVAWAALVQCPVDFVRQLA